jgi:outer membrane protein W
MPACVAVACLGASSAYADEDIHVKIYGGAAYVAPMSDSDVTLGTVTDTVQAEKQVGWNFGIEGRFGKWVGLEVDYVNADEDVQFGGTTIGTANFSPLSATLNIHVVHTTIVDFYVGPSYSYVNWGDIKLNQDGQAFFSTTGLATDSSNGWGAALGLDIGFGKHFAITGGLRYIDVPLQVQGGSSVAVNPLVGRLGVALRF